MAVATPDLSVLGIIDKLEQSLDGLRPHNDEERALRAKIEEAIEIGYEVAYGRSARRLSRVINFPDRRRADACLRG